MSPTLVASRAIALLLVGIYAGGVFFFVIAPSVGRLPADAYVRYWQALNVDYGRAMPPLLLAAIAALSVGTVVSWRRSGAVFGFSLAALLLVVLTVVLTVTAMEPLNRIANSWSPDQLPSDWQQFRKQWLNWHLVRTTAAVAAFGCLLAAATIDKR